MTKYREGNQIKEDEMGGACSTYRDRSGACRAWWGDLRETDHLEELVMVGSVTLRCIIKKRDGRMWTGFIWLRLGTGDRLL